ncbi:MAG TPA: amidohydrolase family protein, partial [Ilumatobacteraceae bacterium]|nr:amidohydrolase family protein [Ilumatobacteraceae bacterium]
MTDTLNVQDLKVIDTDTHISEPADLWTSRLPAKFQDIAPRVQHNEATGHDHWRVGDYWLMGSGFYAVAGWKEFPPNGPHDLDHPEVDKGSYDPNVRLQRMDEHGIYAQVLYPNLIGFETGQFMKLGLDAALACVQVYNDFQTEFASTDPKRFIPITMVPFWDLEESEKEIRRCHEMGHRGILFANKYEQIGLPAFTDTHWDPIYKTCAELDTSVNYHVGFSSSTDGSAQAMTAMLANFSARAAAVGTAIGLMSNGDSIARIITSGVCERHPTVNFVSVESGFGFIPYLLDSLDWHWKGYGASRETKSDMLPSEYFARQCYGTFWFETSTLRLLDTYPDNFMFETDYPHPTAMSPG